MDKDEYAEDYELSDAEGSISNAYPQRTSTLKIRAEAIRSPAPPVPLFNSKEQMDAAASTLPAPRVRSIHEVHKEGARRGGSKLRRSFVLPEEKIYRELLLMPACWNEGDEGEFVLTVWTNTPVQIERLDKTSLQEMKRNLRK